MLSGIRPYVDDRAVCIDVGANIGLYSLALSLLAPNGHVYAFEPSRHAFEYLKKNLAQNGVGNVSVSQLALGQSDQNVRFHDIPFFTAGSFTVDEDCFLTSEILGSSFYEAPCTTLDAFVRNERIDHIDLVKVDVEGGELPVIEGALETIEQHKPLVLMEFSSFALTLTQSTLPQVALDRIKEIFPFIFVIGRNDGLLRRLSTGSEMYDFLYDNGIHGPIDNLLCSFTDLGVTRGYVREAVLKAQADAKAAGVTAEQEVAGSPAAPSGSITGFGSKVRRRLVAVLQRGL